LKALSIVRRTVIFAALAAFALTLSACGVKQDTISTSKTKSFTVMLDWFPNADHAPLYSALAAGDFRAAGLELLLARDEGLKLVSIAALVQRPLTSIIALPSAHISSVADLAGKTVGTAGIPYQAAELKSALLSAGVNPSSVHEVNVGFNLVPAMLSGKVAATLGGYWNYESLQLQLLHKHPVTIPIDQAGVPTYDELVLVVREEEARSRGQDLRAFLQALTRGERAVRANPAAAASLVMKANPSLEPKLQLASIERTLPAALPAGSKPYGYQDPTAWSAFGSWMFAHGLLRHSPNTALPPFTNEFLPGEGLGKSEE
jgi:putative hydroxymethylpyrimidine transport system substrate-binding protein